MAAATETIAAPAARPHAATAQPGFEFTHTDGTVYHAENAESAMAACPVLGKMALEDAALLLEIAAIGQQKIQEEQQTAQQEEARRVEAPLAEVAAEIVPSKPTRPAAPPAPDVQVVQNVEPAQQAEIVTAYQADEPTTPRATALNEAVEHRHYETIAAVLDEPLPAAEAEPKVETSHVAPASEKPEPPATIVAASEALDQPIEQVAWDDELIRKPAKIFESFVDALQALPTPVESEMTATPATGVDQETQTEPMPPIAVTVVERLNELTIEEKQTAVPLVKNIVEAIQAITLLAAEGSGPKSIESAQAELQELVIALFEHLGIGYEAEDIQHFAALLLWPAFQPPQPEQTLAAVDLEHDGTHEAKRNLTLFVGTLAENTEHDAKQLVGALVLSTQTDA